MKKTLKSKALLLALSLVLCCLFVPMTAVSAAMVTDGTNLYEAGDANNDGEVNICDLVAANIGEGKTAASDLDGDGTVGAYDFALVRAIILGIDNSQWTE